ncbi:hypothetical protein EJB05_52075, partial [Eragrostis curvula]
MKATVVFLLHLVAFLSLAAACLNVPSMSVEDACRTATGTPLMYGLCKDALCDVAFATSGVDLYALVAAKRALASYGDTARAISDRLSGAGGAASGSLVGDEKDAYDVCAGAYSLGTGIMEQVADAMIGCRFGDDLGKLYKDGIAQMETCRDKLLTLTSSPLYDMNLGDRNKAILAYFLGRLLGVQ